MFGTIVNTAAILICSLLGVLLRDGLKEKYRSILEQAMALSVLFVGISGALDGMLNEAASPVLYIASLAIGGLAGEFIDVEHRLEALGNTMQKKFSSRDGAKSKFSEGFVSASLLFCVGTMAVLGSIQSGVQGDHTILLTKSLIDGITAIVFASTLGMGVAFSAMSVFAYQALLTLLAKQISPILTDAMMLEIGIIGGVMIAGIGLNMLHLTKIRVGNFLPALLVPIMYLLIQDVLYT